MFGRLGNTGSNALDAIDEVTAGVKEGAGIFHNSLGAGNQYAKLMRKNAEYATMEEMQDMELRIEAKQLELAKAKIATQKAKDQANKPTTTRKPRAKATK